MKIGGIFVVSVASIALAVPLALSAGAQTPPGMSEERSLEVCQTAGRRLAMLGLIDEATCPGYRLTDFGMRSTRILELVTEKVGGRACELMGLAGIMGEFSSIEADSKAGTAQVHDPKYKSQICDGITRELREFAIQEDLSQLFNYDRMRAERDLDRQRSGQ